MNPKIIAAIPATTFITFRVIRFAMNLSVVGYFEF